MFWQHVLRVVENLVSAEKLVEIFFWHYFHKWFENSFQQKIRVANNLVSVAKLVEIPVLPTCQIVGKNLVSASKRAEILVLPHVVKNVVSAVKLREILLLHTFSGTRREFEWSKTSFQQKSSLRYWFCPHFLWVVKNFVSAEKLV